jgi:hypothetical protein
MKQKSTEKAKPKTQKAQFNLYAPGAKRLFLPGDFEGCVLVFPEGFAIHKDIRLYPKRFSDYHL